MDFIVYWSLKRDFDRFKTKPNGSSIAILLKIFNQWQPLFIVYSKSISNFESILMASVTDIYSLQWNNHAMEFSIASKDLWQQNELIDVTLVVDGYMINAHRLVLSAISPYFRQMFTSIPVNQQAFVFMKDVSKRTLEQLMTFIYTGEVNVEQSNLDEFQKTGAALKIKGFDGLIVVHSIDSFSSAPVVHHKSQYQSTQTTQFHEQYCDDGFKGVQKSACHHNEMDHRHLFEIETIDDYYAMDDIDQQHSEQQLDNNNGSENEYQGNDNKITDFQKSSAPKRAKRTPVGFGHDIIADIRTNPKNGRQNLFHANHKFTKNVKTTKTQGWRCGKHASRKCQASLSTTEIDGVMMMKVCIAEHTH